MEKDIIIRRRKPRAKGCYHDVMRTMNELDKSPALSVLKDLGGVYAVHGYITDIGRFTHAWVEIRGGDCEYVYDQIRSKTLFEREAYYMAHNAVPVRVMTGIELARLILKHNHSGPFIEEERG